LRFFSLRFGWFRFRRIQFGMFGEVLLGVVGDFADHVILADVEVDITGVSYGDVQRFEDEGGALVVDGAL
jgi:hypothetical protein